MSFNTRTVGEFISLLLDFCVYRPADFTQKVQVLTDVDTIEDFYVSQHCGFPSTVLLIPESVAKKIKQNESS